MWKNKGRLPYWIMLIAMSAVMVSCGTKKALVDTKRPDGGTASTIVPTENEKMDFMRMVYDNEVYTQSIASKIKFTINTGRKDLSVSGSLRMKKDEVIRIQLTPLGLMEVGRLEFTKDYVLLMDRMNKEYVKASYSDVDFLRKNGLDFYALQALFWNQLFVPGEQEITDSTLKKFSVTFSEAAAKAVISLQRGSMDYRWNADKATGRLRSVDVTYSGTSTGKTTVTCNYGSFKAVGRKQFPTDITLLMKSDAVKGGNPMSVNISINDIDTDGDWDTFTSISGKYKQVSVQDVMNRLLKM